jgi:hypothetical protein
MLCHNSDITHENINFKISLLHFHSIMSYVIIFEGNSTDSKKCLHPKNDYNNDRH